MILFLVLMEMTRVRGVTVRGITEFIGKINIIYHLIIWAPQSSSRAEAHNSAFTSIVVTA